MTNTLARIAHGLTLAATIAGLLTPAFAGVPADTGLKERQAAVLRLALNDHAAARLTPDHAYSTNRSDSVRIGSDAAALVGRLELERRGLPGGLSPRDGGVLAGNMARTLVSYVGTKEKRGPWARRGAPGMYFATSALSYALHRYGREWPADVKESIRALIQDGDWLAHSRYVGNCAIDLVAAELLVGEALGNKSLWERGLANLASVCEHTMRHGAIEMNAPLYTAHDFPQLLYLQALNDRRARSMGTILLEYVLLVQAHLWLPGGALGVPQSRDYGGGAGDGGSRAMEPLLWLLIGDPAMRSCAENAYLTVVPAAAVEYAVPETIRSIFLDKGEGYTFWTRMPAVHGRGRTPYSVNALGLEGEQVSPWQCVMLPDGIAAFGVAYGWTMNGHVSSGVYVRRPAGGFAILYQYQPNVTGDTDDTGATRILGATGQNADPDDFQSELYDYERLVHDRTLLMLWDPTTNSKPTGVVRTYPDTRVHLPDWRSLGGEACRGDYWRVGRLGEVYIGYCPLGKVSVEESRERKSGEKWTYMRLDGPSGGIVELATRAEFPSVEAYAENLSARHLVFNTDPLSVEVDARDRGAGRLVRVKLEFRPERRWVDGRELSEQEALGHGLMESPWARWDPATRRLAVNRDGYPTLVYDWDDAKVEVKPAR
ncbi:MAG: hypothetical protein JXR37_28795 [Kiritimatiellae bacterium]|nr:hypothetical protein [Kiritimatiellia bacterium]